MFNDAQLAEVYSELRKIAAIHLSRSARQPSLQATQLVHEARMRLAGRGYNSRTHFLALASRTMRMVLIDAIRARTAQKRQGVAFEGGDISLPIERVIEVDRALDELALKDPRNAQVVEMRFFGGLEFQEIADALEISLPPPSATGSSPAPGSSLGYHRNNTMLQLILEAIIDAILYAVLYVFKKAVVLWGGRPRPLPAPWPARHQTTSGKPHQY